MDIRYQIVLYIGIGVIALLLLTLFVNKSTKKNFKGGKKVVGLEELKAMPYFRHRVIIYKIAKISGMIGCLIAVATSFIIMARPYEEEIVKEEKYNRDIILCMDVSTSVDELNESLVLELKDTVEQLKGERIGIVIFNTSPVLLLPLTDDYEFVMESLDNIAESLNVRNSVDYGSSSDPYEWIRKNDYIMSGTLIGNEDLGSSLIGDGLAAAAYDFTDGEAERSRFIIFSTDNDLAGTERVNLKEAGEICSRKDIVVFGIGTVGMKQENITQMKDCVESTGGKLYMQEESGSMKDIVNKIDKSEQSMIQGDIIVNRIDRIGVPMIILLISVSIMLVSTKIVGK